MNYRPEEDLLLLVMTIWGLTGARNKGIMGLVGNGENAPEETTFAVFGPERGLWGWIKCYISRILS